MRLLRHSAWHETDTKKPTNRSSIPFEVVQEARHMREHSASTEQEIALTLTRKYKRTITRDTVKGWLNYTNRVHK